MLHLERDDEVYFNDRDGPRRGRVLCHGKHGCTVECDGRRQRVKWEHVLGHHKRAQPEHRLVEQGEDGAILEDARGRRRYLHGYGQQDRDEQQDDDEEQPMDDDKPERILKALFPDRYGLAPDPGPGGVMPPEPLAKALPADVLGGLVKPWRVPRVRLVVWR